jgi:bis(5'-nucleosyl)-tetraphosphatase (symmetrical)
MRDAREDAECYSYYGRIPVLFVSQSMATYAVGDLQGCNREFQELLRRISFDRDVDTLWLVGDLVNRGPESLETLRAVTNLGSAAVTVLGNHDLHLLAASAGVRAPARGDTLDDILAAPDSRELLDWIRHRPVAIFEKIEGSPYLMVHAGILPDWTVTQTLHRAKEVERVLRSDDWRSFIGVMYGNSPNYFSEDLSGNDRLRSIVNVLTRLRFCTPDGVMDFSANQGAETAPPGFSPWFELRPDKGDEPTLITGHWSALGLRTSAHHLGVDSGCVWGGALTAIRLEDRAIFQQPCPRFQRPAGFD